MEQKQSIKIGKRTFLFSAIVLLVLMIIAGVLSYVLPAGAYDQVEVDGRITLVEGSYHATDTTPLPIWRWFTAPFETLAGEDSLTIIVIIVFLLFLGGAFTVLNHSGALQYGVWTLSKRFGKKRYLLLSLVSLFFMALGSFAGIFEESILLAPVAVVLATALGFDIFTGLFISLLSTGFGFASGVFNPFTTGVAQKLAGIPVFSGAPYRILSFVLIYALLTAFIQIYARKVAKDKQGTIANEPPVDNVDGAKRAAVVFVAIFVLVFLWVLATSFMDGLSDYTMPALAILFLLGGIIAGFSARLGAKGVFKGLLEGMGGVAPGVLLILMASSVKYIMSTSGVMHTVLNMAHNRMEGMGAIPSSLSVYALVLFLNFFIGSGSAKAFLVMPIIAPLTNLAGVSSQTAVLAFLFGDGFSNVFYITNPVLLITLGITGVSYGQWFKKTWLLQVLTLALTVGLTILAVVIGYH